MSGAARDLLAHLNCASVYTESDEISCMFRSIDADLRVDREAQRADGVPESELPQLPTREELLLRMSHRGNVQKMTTLSAAYCSVRFCYHLSQEEMTEAVRKQVCQLHHFLSRSSLLFILGLVYNIFLSNSFLLIFLLLCGFPSGCICSLSNFYFVRELSSDICSNNLLNLSLVLFDIIYSLYIYIYIFRIINISRASRRCAYIFRTRVDCIKLSRSSRPDVVHVDLMSK